jgi:hypothetical protein
LSTPIASAVDAYENVVERSEASEVEFVDSSLNPWTVAVTAA